MQRIMDMSRARWHWCVKCAAAEIWNSYEGYPKVSGLGHNEINNNKNTHWEAVPRVMAEKLTGLTHRVSIQLHLVAESCTTCSSRSRQPVRKLLGHPRILSNLTRTWAPAMNSHSVRVTQLLHSWSSITVQPCLIAACLPERSEP